MKQVLLLCVTLLLVQSTVRATGEPSTYFNIFVPPNNDAVQRNACLIVTALFDSTYVDIVDDDMDGDNDDNFQGYLMAGQSYILYIKDNGINDDAMYASGGVLKQDGDYFIINADKAVYASQSTNSDWQHDWVPSTNRTSKGKKFIIYSPPTSNSPRDLNAFAYEDSTVITVRKISFQNTVGTGLTNVDPNAQNVVYQKTINVGEDIIYNYTGGRDLLASGETYIVESNKDITVQYGALWTNSRDGGGYVPSENGSSSGSTFYFAVPYQANYEQEVRIVSWDMSNTVELSYYANGVWNSLDNWALDAMEGGDWVGSTVPINIPHVFRVSCTAGKKVSVFEANWMETGSPGTSDMATMVSSAAGSTAGKDFLVYMNPPGNEHNVLNPFTGNNFGGRFTHAYLFARDTAHVVVKDAYSDGGEFFKSYTILPGRYVDCALSEQEWKEIYNGDGNPTSGPERPYLRITSDRNISVMNTNFNDNWMMYFGSSQGKSFDQNSSASATDATPGETIIVSSQVDFKNADSIENVQIEVVVSSGAIPTQSNLINETLADSLEGNITTTLEKSIIEFENEPTLHANYDYRVETEIEMQVNYLDGNPVPNNTVINIETIVTGEIDGVEEQSISSEGVQNKSADVSQLLFVENDQLLLTQVPISSWTANWVDVDGDNDDDLFVPTYESNAASILFINNGSTFSAPMIPELTNKQNGVVASTWADIDNDGDRDCFIASNQGTNQLLINEGNLGFTAQENDPSVTDGGYNHGASWADYNNDGLVDLFVLDFMPTAFNKIYKQNSGNSFEAVNTIAPALTSGRSLGASWSDFDNDGDQDLFVPQGNGENNVFYINLGDGSFEKDTTLLITQDGSNSVASAWGDFNNDGFMDLFVSNSSNQPNLLYQNNGQGDFILIENQEPALDFGNSHGCSWADVDNNGFLDLFVSNDQNQEKYLYMNENGVLRKEKNEVITAAIGNTFGHYWSDYDQDGDLDLYVTHHGQESNTFYINQGNTNNHWLTIKLKGTVSNASAVGTRVKIKTNKGWQMRAVNAQSGLGGQHSFTQHFGLGNATVVDSIQIYWPSGIVEYRSNIAADQKITIVESNQALITGQVYSDDNLNCNVDSLERGVAGTKVMIPSIGLSTISDQNGFYELWVEPGNYAIEQEDAIYWEGTNCQNHTVTITSNSQSVQNIDFANTKTSVGVDLSISYNMTALRRGFVNESAVLIQNKGTEDLTEPVTIQISFPTEITPLSATPLWTNNNSSTYTWTLESLERGATYMISLQDSVDLYATMGDEVNISGAVTIVNNELNTSDNEFTISETIVGAIDPNDMIVTPVGAGTRGLVNKSQPLTYKIRFQNVGTYAARDVTVISKIPEGTAIESFEMVGSSHDYRLTVNGRSVQWVFSNINLPDSSTNEAESHGFVTFKVLPEKEVEAGAEIKNNAEIVFDYEAAIKTNRVMNTIYDHTISHSKEVKVFPNPTSSNVFIVIEGLFEINEATMLDGLGRRVPVSTNSKNALLRVNWAKVESGVYFLVLDCSDNIRRTTKVIVQ